MRYVFFGTPKFAAIILERLIEAGFIPAVVVCNPDRPVGRKQIVTPPAVKTRIMNYELGIRERILIWQPESLKNQNPLLREGTVDSSEAPDARIGTLNKRVTEEENKSNNVAVDKLNGESIRQAQGEPAEGFAPSESRVPILDPHSAAGSQGLLYKDYDFFIVAAYGKIIPKEIIAIPHFGTIGVHPSLLPKYRGPTPIQSVILNGEKETGVTLFLMDEKVDHGNIVMSNELGVMRNDTYETLEQKLAELGAKLLTDFLRKSTQIYADLYPSSRAKLTTGHSADKRRYEKMSGTPQDETQATYTKKFTTEDGYVEPADLKKAEKEGGEIAVQIERKIRALNPEPGVWTYSYEITKKYENTKTTANTKQKRVKLLEAEIIDGKLKLKKIQVEGKKPMAFL